MENDNHKEEPKPVVMTIEMQPDGSMKVNFPGLKDKIATYGFLKMAEKVLDNHYAQIAKSQIIKPRIKDIFLHH